MIAAIIPTRRAPRELATLVSVLATDGVLVIVLPSEGYGHHIYRMWNAGVALARQAGATEIAILNDDIAILPGTLPFMAAALHADPTLGIVYPDATASLSDGLPTVLHLSRTTGTWGGGGMTGFAFMFRAADHLPAFDEGYNWWYGDDAFEADVRAAEYGVARICGLPLQHRPDGTAEAHWDVLGPLVELDRARWATR